MLLDEIMNKNSYKDNIKKYKTSYINKNDMSLIKVLAVSVFVDKEVEVDELSNVRNILSKLYTEDKTKLLLSGVIEKIKFYDNNPNSFEEDKQLAYNLILKNNIFFDYMKKIFKSDVEFSPEEKMFYLSIKNSNDFKYGKINPKLLRELEMKYEQMKIKPKREYIYNPQPSFG